MFLGYCKNYSCQTYNKGRVISGWGYRNGGVFNLFRDKHLCKCPLCDQNFEPTNFGFLNTWYKTNSREWQFTPSDFYTTFSNDDYSSNLVELEIEVAKYKP